MIYCGDCLDVMRGMEPNSVDAIVTDPPYGLSFMGKNWDHGIPGVPFWTEALRVAKPGCHLLAFGGTRTFHRLACAIEDAGWEIRDMLMWVYGSGFPKSHNLKGEHEGWGTALKPAWEPIVLARKPLDGTVAANVQKWGTGVINVDGCRVSWAGTKDAKAAAAAVGFRRSQANGSETISYGNTRRDNIPEYDNTVPGRWPANLIHDGSEEVLELFPETENGSGHPTVKKRQRNKGWCNSSPGEGVDAIDNFGDSGSAARFFYCAKASRAEREAGCEGMDAKVQPATYGDIGPMDGNPRKVDTGHIQRIRNAHPCVKPLALMRYLVRLITPPGGTILDPFMGSGTTGMAAKQEGFGFLGIEKEGEYVEIAERRIDSA